MTTSPLPSLIALLVLPLLTIIVLLVTVNVEVLVVVVVPVTVRLPVIVALPVTLRDDNVPIVVKLLLSTVEFNVLPDKVPAAAPTTIFEVPSNDTPLIVLAVCNAVAVPALPVTDVIVTAGVNVNTPVPLL